MVPTRRSLARWALLLLCTGVVVGCSSSAVQRSVPGAQPMLGKPASTSPGAVAVPPMVRTAIQPRNAMSSPRTVKADIIGFNWTQIPGSASQVAAAADGSIWVLSTQPSGPDKYIWHYVNGAWANISGLASQIAVAPNGTLYVINSGGGTYSYSGGTWTALGGGASAITVASDGSTYVMSNGGAGPDQPIWKYSNGWSQAPGAGVQLAASWDSASFTTPGGAISANGLYVLNSIGSIYCLNTSSYTQLPGGASAIAPTTNGGVFVLGYPKNASGNTIFYYNLSTPGWSAPGGAGVSISAGPSTLYVVGASGAIYFTLFKTTATRKPAIAYLSGYSPGSIQDARGIQVMQLEDTSGNALAQPTYKFVSTLYEVKGLDATPSGSYGVAVYGAPLEPSAIQVFTGFDKGTPLAVGPVFDLFQQIGVPGAVAVFPNGDRAIVTQEYSDAPGKFASIAGLAAANPSVAAVIPFDTSGTLQADSLHRYVHVAADGSYLIVRGSTTTYVATITNGAAGYTYNIVSSLPNLGKNTDAQGNGGFAINPQDPSQAIFVSGPVGNDVFYVTGLPRAPTVTHFLTPEPAQLSAVEFTPDGRYAVIAGANGVQVYKGFGTGTLTRVGGVFGGTFTMEDGQTHSVASVWAMGITPDGKYVAAAVTDKNPAWQSGQLIGSMTTLAIDGAGNLSGPVGVRNAIIPPSVDDDIMIVR